MDGDIKEGRPPPARNTVLRLTAEEEGTGIVHLARPGRRRDGRNLHFHIHRARDDAPQVRDPDADLATLLVDRGLAAAAEIAAARMTAKDLDLPLGRVLLARGAIGEGELLAALSEVHGTDIARLTARPPDRRLATFLPRDVALAAEAVPWRDAGGAVIVATARPDLFADLAETVGTDIRIVPALATRDEVLAAQTALWGEDLAREAETRAPEHLSCRTWQPRRVLLRGLPIAAALTLFAAAFPMQAALVILAITLLVFVANVTLKTAAFVTMLSEPSRKHLAQAPPPDIAPHLLRPPVVSILVPLFREAEIAGRLVGHLNRMRYPPERLDVILLVEEDDTATAAALRDAPMPHWMRVITVPRGHPRTKPRALNYALSFARGEIIGIYDAEDRPDPNQIAHVVRRFDELTPEVACLQGRLDYYNADHNLMAGLFTAEYASWFRVVLPGVQRMGLFVPLGGTTLFLRRDPLEKVGGWDAHNVTEDAELGLRLARAGYRTELIDTTTFEEANAAVLPWVRQRSRWLKGYLITWATAMRQPVELWRDLGPWRFFGLQAQMLAAVLGFFLAPVLWSLVLLPFDIGHPLNTILSPAQGALLGLAMMGSFVLSVAVTVHACAPPHLRRLRKLAPMVEFYYTFGTFAAWLGAMELLSKPFFWAKTRHGIYGGLAEAETETTQNG